MLCTTFQKVVVFLICMLCVAEAKAELLQQLRFENNLEDSLNNYDASGTGAVGYVAGEDGWEGESAVQWVDATARAWIQADAALNSPDFTQMYWVYVPSADPGHDLYLTDGGNFPVWMSYPNGFSLWSWTSANGWIGTNYTPQRNQWIHFAWTYDQSATTLILYANGRIVFRETDIVLDRSGASYHFLGSDASGANTFGAVGGKMDDYRMYNTVLTEREIQEILYHDGLVLHLPFDDNWEDGVYTHDVLHSSDAVLTSVTRFGTGAAAFQNYLGHGWLQRKWEELAPTTFTISFWLRIPSSEVNYGAARLLSMSNFGFDVAHYGDETISLFNDDNHAEWVQNLYIPEREQWVHLAWTGTASELTLYADGEKVWSQSLENPIDWSNDEWINFGAVGNGTEAGTENFNGILDDFRLYNRALSPSEIAGIYPAGKAKKPVPWDQVCQVDTSTTLQWQPGVFAQKHRLYVSDVLPLDSQHFIGEQSATSYTLTDLQDKKDYYWRVDEVNAEGGITTGNTWTFQVRAGVSVADWDVRSDTWAAADALGRVMPSHEDTGSPRSGKKVGIFYFMWLGKHGRGGPYDLTEMIAHNPSDPPFGPENAFHHWGESQFGYYLSNDEYVIRKHAQELADAGVDTLILDVTNGYPYTSNYMKICRVLQDMRDEGSPTPQVCFFAFNGDYSGTVQSIYENLYAKGLYPELWFRWQGKPLMLSPSSGLSQEVLEFFNLRESWAFSDWTWWFGTGQHKWPWLDDYPQGYGWDVDAETPEEIAVAVASHPTRNRGRSYSNYSQPLKDQFGLTGFEDLGLCFEEQWSRVHEVDPDFVFITGWNEWVAQRFIDEDGGDVFLGDVLQPGDSYFVDVYNQEYNRDIEPMRGGHEDNYYYQMASHIRRYKGVRPAPVASNSPPIVIDGNFDDWREVHPEFRDHRGDAVTRSHAGWGSVGTYENSNARNDFEVLKVARDVNALYFYVRTVRPLTPMTGENWMLLLIDADCDYGTGWQGYDYILNRTGKTNASTTLEENGGGWNWANPTAVDWKVGKWEMEIKIPLQIFQSNAMKEFQFKWSDNMQESEIHDEKDRAMQFRLNGDAAPDLRFRYDYRYQPISAAKNWSLYTPSPR